MFAEIKLKMRREFGRVVWTVYVASVSCVLPAASQKERSVVVPDPDSWVMAQKTAPEKWMPAIVPGTVLKRVCVDGISKMQQGQDKDL